MIAAIENAILERLRLAGETDVLGYAFRTLESYPEDFDAHLKEKVRGRAFPAAWVVFGGWGPARETGDEIRVAANFQLVVASENLRNETSQRHGDGSAKSGPGSYQLVMDAAGLLHGQTLGLDVDRLELGPCRSVRPTQAIAERKLSLFALELTTSFPVARIGFGLTPPADFSTFSADWDVPAFGGVDADPGEPGVQLPAAGQADASDLVELPS